MKKTSIIFLCLCSMHLAYSQETIYSKQCALDPLGDVPNPTWTSGLNKLFVDCPPIFVGINTSEPKVHLDVRGTGSFGGQLAIGVDPLNMLGKLHVKTNLPSGTNGVVMLVENQIRQLFRLENSGLLKVREVKVDADVWSDYVFKDDYILMPLEELEQYIDTNGHLPNVPSEEEVKENGQNLGEMNVILLEKVEELTLYLIEQQKQLKAQQEQILLLQERIHSEE